MLKTACKSKCPQSRFNGLASLSSFSVFHPLLCCHNSWNYVGKALQTSGATQTSTSSTRSMLPCLLKSPEVVLPECAEHKPGGKMMEKHCKSVFFHYELFMAATQVTNRKLVYKVSSTQAFIYEESSVMWRFAIWSPPEEADPEPYFLLVYTGLDTLTLMKLQFTWAQGLPSFLWEVLLFLYWPIYSSLSWLECDYKLRLIMSPLQLYWVFFGSSNPLQGYFMKDAAYFVLGLIFKRIQMFKQW